MKRIMMVLSVCLALAATTVSYGSVAPPYVTDPATEFLGDMIEIAGNESLDRPAAILVVTTTAANIVSVQADEDAEGEEGEKKDEKDEEKDPGGPDRLWDAGKLG